MDFFSKPVVAIAFGAFFLCAETCLHAEELLGVASRPFDLPLHDWIGGGFLLVAGVRSRGASSTVRRQYLAVAWAFMLSLLTGASLEMFTDWLTPPDESDWLSEGTFLALVVMMTLVALCALVSTLTRCESQ